MHTKRIIPCLDVKDVYKRQAIAGNRLLCKAGCRAAGSGFKAEGGNPHAVLSVCTKGGGTAQGEGIKKNRTGGAAVRGI